MLKKIDLILSNASRQMEESSIWKIRLNRIGGRIDGYISFFEQKNIVLSDNLTYIKHYQVNIRYTDQLVITVMSDEDIALCYA